MIDRHDLILMLLLSNCILFVGTIGFAIAWVRARERALKARIDTLSLGEATRNTVQMERALDAIALEVERISEGQRFTTRLLAERDRAGTADRSTSYPKVITPH